MGQVSQLGRRFTGAVAACALILVLSSCASQPTPEAAASSPISDDAATPTVAPDTDLSRLEGTFWRLVKLDGNSRKPRDTILRFAHESVDLSQPLRNTSFRLRVTSLLVAPSWERTGPAGDPEQMIATFERTLNSSVRYRIDGERLSFLDGSGRTLVTADLIRSHGPENREWLIVLYRQGGELVQPTSTIQPRLLFLNGILDGSPGCGRLLGSYRWSRGALEISTGSLVLGPCDQTDFVVQSDAVGKALGGRRRAEVSGDRMWLKDEAGVVQVELAAAPVPALSAIGSRQPSGE